VISTHVLDVTRGKPAEGVTVRLFHIDGDERTLLASGSTDSDGRVAPVFDGDLAPATYVLLFSAGQYFRGQGTDTFFDEIPVRFVIASGEQRYHVPLLLSPFGYSAYRGS